MSETESQQQTGADNPPCSECGAVYPEPHAAECVNSEVLQFSELAKGDRFRVWLPSGRLHDPVYTKIAKKVAKDAEGQWFDVALSQRVQYEAKDGAE